MKKVLALFGLVSLILVGVSMSAAPASPTLIVTCVPDTAGTGCAANLVPTFTVLNLNPHKAYEVRGDGVANFDDVLPTGISAFGPAYSSDGTISSGTETFTLWQLDKSTNLFKQVDGPYTVVFD